VADVKSCIACKRPMAVTMNACPFCQAVQPEQSTDAPREIKCEKCSRKYSTKLVACPFCAKDEAKPQPGVPFRGPGPGDVLPAPPPLVGEDARAEAEAKATGAWLKLAALALLLVLTTLWSFASSVGGDRLGDEDTGLFGPCLLAGVVLAAGTGFLFHRWSDRGALPIAGVVAAAMIIPWAGTAYGMAKWLNAFAIDDREQPIDCVLESKTQQHTKRGANSWVYRYRCSVEGGVELHGTAYDFASIPIAADTGDRVRMTAARGRLGIWLRLSDPVTPPRL
jgi:hypothetical protein